MYDRNLDEPPVLTVPDGRTARQVAADNRRGQLRPVLGADADTLSDAEVNDSFYFTLFPNFHPWGAFNRIVYRFRPNGMSVDEAIMECMFLSPFPPGRAPAAGADPLARCRQRLDQGAATRRPGAGVQPGLLQPAQRPPRPQGLAVRARHVRPLRGVEDPPLAHAPRRAPRPPVIDYARCYHQGVRVPDLDAAMAELGAALSLEWCEPQEREQAIWLPDVGATTVPLRFTYSAAGPQHVELLQGAPGSIWDGTRAAGSAPRRAVVRRRRRRDGEPARRRLDACASPSAIPPTGYGVFTYVQPPSGMLVELVSTAVQPMFERWFAGGPLA